MRAMLTLLVLLAGGCAFHDKTVYVPVGAIYGGEAVYPVKPYAIAGTVEKGTVQVMALDGERLPVGPGAPELYLHLRLRAENVADDETWLFNPNDQMLGYGGGMLSASFSQTSAGPPVLALSRGKGGWLDLYYPLPRDVDPLGVTFWWRVRRGATIVSEKTGLLRITGRDSSEVAYASYIDAPTLPAGLALGWWWPDYCFHGNGGYRRSTRDYSSDSSIDRGSSSSDSSTSSGDSGNWRNPSASTPSDSGGSRAPDPADAGKSAWRR